MRFLRSELDISPDDAALLVAAAAAVDDAAAEIELAEFIVEMKALLALDANDAVDDMLVLDTCYVVLCCISGWRGKFAPSA